MAGTGARWGVSVSGGLGTPDAQPDFMNSTLSPAFFPLLRLAAAAVAISFFGGCQPIDAALDCNTICTRYKDCFDGTYSVATCADRCRAKASNDSTLATAINRCEACIDTRACASASFNCGSDCSNVVP